MIPTSRRRASAAGVTAVLVLTARAAGAGGFQINEESARGLGSAFIGEAAAAEDPTTLFYNPAGATRLRGTQLSIAGTLVVFKADFEDRGSTVNPQLGSERLRGTRTVNAGEVAEVPALHLVHQIADRWRLGLAVDAPWGLSTGYDAGWVGRYHALDSDLKSVDVAPSVAVRLTDQLSAGAGLDIQYVYARLTNSVDLGALCELNAARFGVPSTACAAAGIKVQTTDGFARLRGDSWGLGYNLGLLWEQGGTRVGVSYRSRVDQTIEGEAEFSVPARAHVLQQLSGALTDTGARAALPLPDVVRFGIYHDLTPRWAVLAGVDWTHWSRFEELVVRFDNPKQPALVQPERWHDTLRTGIAALYHPFDRWRFRTGFAYDETPVPNPIRRTPRIPDHDRYWLSAGVAYEVGPRLRLDAGYAHLFSQNNRIDNADPLTGHVIRGGYSGAGDLFSAQATWQFD